jgi:hypothetical protein
MGDALSTLGRIALAAAGFALIVYVFYGGELPYVSGLSGLILYLLLLAFVGQFFEWVWRSIGARRRSKPE